MTSAAVVATTSYSTSVEDGATNLCFLKLQEIALEPRKTILALVEVRSSILPAQLTSKKEWRVSGELHQKL